MHNSKNPAPDQLPTTAKLIKSTLIAVVAATAILVTVVLPAEYGIDPTGVGRLVGLQQMGEIKTSLAKEAAAEKAAALAALSDPQEETPASSGTPQTPEPVAEPQQAPGTLTHETIFTLAPDASTEIKLEMTKGNTVEFAWSTDGEEAVFDLHADSKALSINYHSYTKGSDSRDEGVLEAAFDGFHGWYWKNRTDAPLTITLQTSGQYQSLKRMN
jgi:hypothetical protein